MINIVFCDNDAKLLIVKCYVGHTGLRVLFV